MEPVDGRPPRQAASSGLPAQQCPSHGHIQIIVLRKTECVSIYHRRVPLRTQRSALSSEPIEGTIAPLVDYDWHGPPITVCLFLSLQTFSELKQIAGRPSLA